MGKKVKDKLTAKQAAFCREYVKDFNGAASCVRAGYAERTARISAAKMLTLPNIQNTIKESLQKVEKRTEITVDMIVKKLAMIGFSKDERTQDNIKALELLGKYKQMFTQKIELTGAINVTNTDAAEIRGRLIRDASIGEKASNPE